MNIYLISSLLTGARNFTEGRSWNQHKVVECQLCLGYCSDHFLFTPSLKEGFLTQSSTGWQTYHTWPQTDEMDSRLLVTYSHSLWEDITHHVGPHGGCSWELSRQAGAGGGRLSINQRVG